MNSVKQWLRRVEAWVKQAGNPFNLPDYSKVPKAARVQNPLSERAVFAACAFRRKGYMVQVASEDLAPLSGKLHPDREKALENAWAKGVIWPVPVVKGEFMPDGRFVIRKSLNLDLAAFLKDRQRLVSLQLLELDEDAEATKEKLASISRVIYGPNGTEIPVLQSRITY